MAHLIRMEWRQGETGLGSIYTFNPLPNLTRDEAGNKQAEFDIPTLDGVVIQNLGREKRLITLRGVLHSKTNVFEDLDKKRTDLVDGIARGPGQLHLHSLITSLSNSRHVYYKGQLTIPGIQFAEHTNPYLLDYTMTFICADPKEYIVPIKFLYSDTRILKVSTSTILSNAKVA